jgi:hypothetical protein
MARLAKLVLLGIGLSVIFALFSLIPQDTTSKKDIAKPLVPEQSQSACALVPKVPPNFLTALACLASCLTGSVAHIPKPLNLIEILNEVNILVDELREQLISNARVPILSSIEIIIPDRDSLSNQNHIALSINDKTMLLDFVYNLNILLNPSNIYVTAYAMLPPTNLDWQGAGLTEYSTVGSFFSAFHQSVENAQVIHFNLAGIDGDPLSFAQEFGPNRQRLTAYELYYVASDIRLCSKTIFYNSGGGSNLNPPPEVNHEIKFRICNTFMIRSS